MQVTLEFAPQWDIFISDDYLDATVGIMHETTFDSLYHRERSQNKTTSHGKLGSRSYCTDEE
jgi:hypothetical protein